MKWLASVPVWGDWYVKTYLNRVLPYHRRMGLDGDVTYIVHTNRRADIEPHLERLGCKVEFRTLPGSPDSYSTFYECHNEVFRESEACLFLTADLAFSEGAFDFARAKVRDGKRLIALHCTRTCEFDGSSPPFDAHGMNEWGVEHIHLPYKKNIWGAQPPALKPTNIFYAGKGRNFWTRGFHIHPLAAVRDRRRFDLSGTVDGTLVTAYWPTETFVVQDHEIAGIEFTKEDKFVGDICWNMQSPQDVASIMRDGAKSIHRYFFTHKISLRGEVEDTFDDSAREIYARL